MNRLTIEERIELMKMCHMIIKWAIAALLLGPLMILQEDRFNPPQPTA